MKKYKKWGGFFLLFPFILLSSCEPTVRLTASNRNANAVPASFSKILVLAIGKDLAKRTLGEESIKAELQKQGFTALTSIEAWGPQFAGMKDSAVMRRLLLDKLFDAVVTVRVLHIDEHDRWVPGYRYYGPIYVYQGFYTYYLRVYGYYDEPTYMGTEVEVLLESNLYQLRSGELLWTGQSKAFSKNPTPNMARRYARNIVKAMLDKNVIVH